MFEIERRVLASVVLLAIFFVWQYTAVLPWRADLLVKAVKDARATLEGLPKGLVADMASRVAVRKSLSTLPYNQLLIEDSLKRMLNNRPIDAATWLERAELAVRNEDKAAADHYIKIAYNLWPTRRRVVWQSAMFYIQVGEKNKSLSMLRKYLRLEPTATQTTAVLARRLEPNPKTLIRSLLPSIAPKNREEYYYLAQLFQFARKRGDFALIQEIWGNYSEEAYADKKVVFPYISYMVSAGRADLAISAWNRYRGGNMGRGALVNPGFEEPLENGGFGWRYRNVKGVVRRRDNDLSFEGAYSLHLKFDGTENVDYQHLKQTIPVEAGRTYVLEGYWRGKDITTRSGMIILVRGVGQFKNMRYRTDAMRGTWNWAPFELRFRAPDNAEFIEVGVRRYRTGALDRYISGELWLDKLTLRVVFQEGADRNEQ